jgi:hypothetical protein
VSRDKPSARALYTNLLTAWNAHSRARPIGGSLNVGDKETNLMTAQKNPAGSSWALHGGDQLNLVGRSLDHQDQQGGAYEQATRLRGN